MAKKNAVSGIFMHWRKLPPFLIILAILTVLFTVLRVAFVFGNLDHFEHAENDSFLWMKAFFFGLRLDLIVIFYLSIPIFFLILSKSYAKIIRWVLLLIVIITSFIAALDLAYFRFSKERIGVDLQTFLNSENNISWQVYLIDYWWLFLLVILFVIFFYQLMIRRLNLHFSNFNSSLIKRFGINLSILAVLFFIARGGFRHRPIRSVDTALYVNAPLISASLNPLLLMVESFINSSGQSALPKAEPYPLNQYTPQQPLSKENPPNIIVLIVESFGKEYTGLNHDYCPSFTPHLNELMKKSLVFTHAYANGLKSMDAVPAIFSGIPKLTETSFIKSPQSLKPHPSLYSTFGARGYETWFFHGANNETMGFRPYLINQGLRNYIGIDQYPTDKKEDFDGNWGIYDDPWLQFSLETLNSGKKPFIAGIFTLSSHHPYAVPEGYQDSFPSGYLDIHKSIGYTDYAIHNFLDSCRKFDWFNNTLFVILADHSSENSMHAYRTPSGKYEIPMLFYFPGKIEPGTNTKTVSQIDLLPTLLEFTHHPNLVETIGESVFSKQEGAVCHYDNQTFHITQDNWNLGMNANRNIFLYNLKEDPNCLKNVLENYPDTAAGLKEQALKHVGRYKTLLD